MKKMILAFVAIMTMTAAQAQGNFGQGNGERREVDRTEMTKRRTDDAVKKYNLNEDQAAKLLALNTKYADKIGFGMGGMRGGARGNRPRPNFGDGGGQGLGQGMGQGGQRPEMTEEMREQFAKMRQEREEAQKQYDTELQQIMTPEQYKAYQADQEEMRKNMGRRGNGQRGGRGNRENRQ
jgi:Spy/CpxP family protein refolding chaperone